MALLGKSEPAREVQVMVLVICDIFGTDADPYQKFDVITHHTVRIFLEYL